MTTPFAERGSDLIVAIAGPGLGDFALRVIFTSMVKVKNPDSRIFVVAAPQTRDQATLLLTNPFIDHLIYGRPGMPLPHLPQALWPFLIPSDIPSALWQRLSQAKLVNIWDDGTFAIDADLRDNAFLTIPAPLAAAAERQLLALGLDRSRWFMCLHIRQDGYRGESQHPRSIRDIEPYRRLVERIIQDGGQVVRLGDLTNTEMPAMRGLIDLSRVPQSPASWWPEIPDPRFSRRASTSRWRWSTTSACRVRCICRTTT